MQAGSDAGAQGSGAAPPEGRAAIVPPPGSAAPAPCEPPALYGLDRDVVWMRRKFGAQSCQLLPLPAAAAAPAAATDGAPPLMRLRLELRPTDPAWTPRDGKLLLEVTVGGGYPAAGSLSLVALPTAECSVCEEACRVLSRVWSAEAAALAAPGGVPARGASPLKQLLLSIENRAGDAAGQAEAFLARRVAAPAQVGAPSAVEGVGGAPAADGGDSAAEGGLSWRQRVGAGLWWPCSADCDAAAVRAAALQSAPEPGPFETGRYEAQQGRESGSSGDSEDESDSGSSSRESADGESPAVGDSQVGQPAGSHGGGGRTAVELQLEGLRCANIDALELHTLSLQVRAYRHAERAPKLVQVLLWPLRFAWDAEHRHAQHRHTLWAHCVLIALELKNCTCDCNCNRACQHPLWAF